MVYFRVDANPQIASGHIMRCITIADAVRDVGEDAAFIISDPASKELLDSRGFKYISLQTLWGRPDDEIEELARIIKDNNIKVLMIDSNIVTENYLRRISQLTAVFHVDDFKKFICPIAGLICYSCCWDKFGFEKDYSNYNTRLLLGPEYIPLRKEFANQKPKDYTTDKAASLLIMSGGSDEYNIISRILSAIKKDQFFRIDAVCGVFNPHYETIKRDNEQFNNVYIHSNLKDIYKYMQAADIAISAGGTTLFELSACGTLTVAYSLGPDQIENAKSMHDMEIIRYSGDISNKALIERIVGDLNYLNNLSSEKKKEWSDRMQGYIDGLGAERIAKAMIEAERNFKGYES